MGDLHDIALSILEEIGCVEECPYHPEVKICKNDTVRDAYAIGNKRITEGKLSCDRRELSDAIKRAYEDLSDECPECEKIGE